MEQEKKEKKTDKGGHVYMLRCSSFPHLCGDKVLHEYTAAKGVGEKVEWISSGGDSAPRQLQGHSRFNKADRVFTQTHSSSATRARSEFEFHILLFKQLLVISDSSIEHCNGTM